VGSSPAVGSRGSLWRTADNVVGVVLSGCHRSGCNRDEVPHTARLKAEVHTRERRSYWRGRIRFDQVRNGTPSVQLVHGPNGDTYMNPRTGEVLWTDTDPPETDSDGTSGLS
jgi:hypothetical protein